jgi:hypothetical protein
MQGRQNQQMDLMELAKQRLMFPESSGYRSETGGLMEALRVLQVETIREYRLLITLTTNEQLPCQILRAPQPHAHYYRECRPRRPPPYSTGKR